MDSETKTKLDEIQSAFYAKSQMDQLNAILEKCEDFKKLRDKMYEEFAEDCYGPGGGDFTINAVIRIINGWENGEESVLAKENKKLHEENSELKKKMQKIEQAQHKLSNTILRLVRVIWMDRDSLGENFEKLLLEIVKSGFEEKGDKKNEEST